MRAVGAISVTQVVIPAVAVAAAGVALFIGINRPVQEPPANALMSESARPAPPVAAAPTQPPVQQAAPLASAQQQAKDLATALTPAPPATGDGAVPEFDIVHIEPTGEAVVAGRAAPGTVIELLRNGEAHDRVMVDQSGQFAMVPRPLPKGTYELTLRSTQADGKQTTSKQSVAVVLEPNSDQPTVALLTPDKPTLVMPQASAPASAAEITTAVEAVDIEPNGKVHVSGHAHPGAEVRLYLNDSFVTSVTAGPDGHLAVTINEGVAPGKYRVRLDELASKSGAVRARAEVPLRCARQDDNGVDLAFERIDRGTTERSTAERRDASAAATGRFQQHRLGGQDRAGGRGGCPEGHDNDGRPGRQPVAAEPQLARQRRTLRPDLQGEQATDPQSEPDLSRPDPGRPRQRDALKRGWGLFGSFVMAGLDPAIHPKARTLPKNDGCPGQAWA